MSCFIACLWCIILLRGDQVYFSKMGVLLPKINEESRVIVLNKKEFRFVGNKIDTAKYSIATFLPKSLLLQFTRLSNVIFLANAVLQSISIISTISPLTAIGPLAFVLSLSMLRQGYEDYKRHKKDWEINSRRTEVLINGQFLGVDWDEVRPGDLVRIKNGELIPADTLLLTSSAEGGMCYVQTANLDGESNLKQKRTVPQFAHLTSGQLHSLQGVVAVQKPSPNLFQFQGKVELQGRESFYIEFCNLLLRETVLRNTDEVIGLALYCGHDSKILRNQGKIHHKISNIERQINYIQVALMILLVLLCTFSSVGYSIVHEQNHLRVQGSYVPQTGFALHFESMLMFFTIFLLLNFLIPITLNILIEGIKTFSALFLYLDRKLYDRTLKHHCGVLNSSIIEQLGLIDCVLTDKTGTLTANQMIFRAVAIERQVYLREQIEQEVESLAEDPRFYELMLAMALCHDVVRDTRKDQYQGSSPDEVCFVNFAHSIGFNFIGRSRQAVVLQALGQRRRFELVEVIAFSSRRRMSVIVRDPTAKNRVTMYTKGADSAIFQKAHWYADSEAFNSNIDVFAKDGLRTLVFAKKVILGRELKHFMDKKELIRQQIRQRIISKEEGEARELELVEQLENNLQIIGATGIEDRLQEHVPRTLSRLQQAGIKVMMITGDKLETAQNIGYLSELIREDYKVYSLSVDIEDPVQYCENIRNQTIDGLPFTLIVEGKHIAEMMQHTHPSVHLFASLLAKANSVIFCRSSPKEKAVIVRFVKRELKLTVLAIGDGGNDVGMIEEAHVGIGILGKQGNSAASVSDFSIGQFHFLDRLVLHHGRWFYYRLSYFFVSFGLKNMAITIVIFLYLLDSAYSGSMIITQFYYSMYNCYIAISILVNSGLFDQDINDDLEPALWPYLPRIYSETKQKELFSYWRYLQWSVAAVALGAAIYYVIKFSLMEAICNEEGHVGDLVTARIANGIALNCVIIAVHYIDNQSHTSFFINFVFLIASVLASAAYFITENYMFILGVPLAYTDNFNIRFWLTMLIIVGAVYVLKVGYDCVRMEMQPSTIDLYKIAIAEDEERKEQLFASWIREEGKENLQESEGEAEKKYRQWSSNVHNITTEAIKEHKKYRSANLTIQNTEEYFHEDPN